MNICIRADGGSTIGMGHIMRTLVLAEELKKNYNVFYVCRIDESLSDRYKPGIDLVKNKGFKVITINENKVKKEIVNVEADCIITDSYDVDEEYFDILRENFSISGCIYDTDYKDINIFNVDFFINPDLYALEQRYITKNCSEILLGPKYIILRKEFLEFQDYDKCMLAPVIKNIIITLGGSNCNIYIHKILESIKDLKQFNFYVVLGSAFKDREELLKEYQEYSNIKIKYNVSNMCDLMSKCDLAISSCSTTLYELMCLGIPTICVATVDNQIIMGNYLKKVDFVKICEVNLIKKNILNLTLEKRKFMCNTCRQIIDGNGVKRIVNAITNLYKSKILEAKS